MNKGIRWNMRAVLTLLVGMVGVHCSVLLNAGPDGYPKPVLYELTDTVIYYGRAAQMGEDSLPVIIYLPNLPIRDLSYREIIDLFGTEAVDGKDDGYPAYSIPYFWDRFPRVIAEKCAKLDEKYVYRVYIHYRDGSGDYLLLWVYEEDNDVKVLWGLRAHPTRFNFD